MPVPNAEYWAGRMRNLEDALLDTGADYLQNLEAQFNRAIADIEKDIAMWYQRFADNNSISYAEARRWLTGANLREFLWSVQEYIKYGEENALNGQWIKELKNASAKVHISRLDALKLQLQQRAEVLYGNQLDELDVLMRRIYTEGYYHNAYELQRGIGTGWTLHSIDENLIDKALSRPWTADMRTFRDRVWTNKQALVDSVNLHLTQMIIRGEGPHKAIDAVARDMGVAKHKAARLVMTESAAFSSAAKQDCFRELGVEKYVIVATLDADTSELCRSLDGTVFQMPEYTVGLTAPPFHPWCRTCTAPYFEDMEHLGQRARRDTETGRTVADVPRSMTYGEWRDRFLRQAPTGPSSDAAFDPKTAKEGLKKALADSNGLHDNVNVLKYYLENTDFAQDTGLNAAIAYDHYADVLKYNPGMGLPTDAAGVLAHELAHRADRLYYHAAESPVWQEAVKEALNTAKTHRDQTLRTLTKWHNTPSEPYVSDVINALLGETDEILYGHSDEYWLRPLNREREIFADLSVLDALYPETLTDAPFGSLHKALKHIMGGG